MSAVLTVVRLSRYGTLRPDDDGEGPREVTLALTACLTTDEGSVAEPPSVPAVRVRFHDAREGADEANTSLDPLTMLADPSNGIVVYDSTACHLLLRPDTAAATSAAATASISAASAASAASSATTSTTTPTAVTGAARPLPLPLKVNFSGDTDAPSATARTYLCKFQSADDVRCSVSGRTSGAYCQRQQSYPYTLDPRNPRHTRS